MAERWPRRFFRRYRWLIRQPAICLLMSALGGCTAFIVPPDAPPEPVSVFLLDHGLHSSLVLPLEREGSVRYSYGDWDYYVLRHTGAASTLRALFRPTPAALGRQTMPGPPELDGILRQMRVEVVSVVEVRADADAVSRLRDELGALFEAASHTRYYHAERDTHFVRHPEPYTAGNNSNRMVSRWLEQLGCTIEGSPLLSRWALAPVGGEH